MGPAASALQWVLFRMPPSPEQQQHSRGSRRPRPSQVTPRAAQSSVSVSLEAKQASPRARDRGTHCPCFPPPAPASSARAGTAESAKSAEAAVSAESAESAGPEEPRPLPVPAAAQAPSMRFRQPSWSEGDFLPRSLPRRPTGLERAVSAREPSCFVFSFRQPFSRQPPAGSTRGQGHGQVELQGQGKGEAAAAAVATASGRPRLRRPSWLGRSLSVADFSGLSLRRTLSRRHDPEASMRTEASSSALEQRDTQSEPPFSPLTSGPLCRFDSMAPRDVWEAAEQDSLLSWLPVAHEEPEEVEEAEGVTEGGSKGGRCALQCRWEESASVASHPSSADRCRPALVVLPSLQGRLQQPVNFSLTRLVC